MNQQTDNAPDTLLEQVKELRGDIDESPDGTILPIGGVFVKQMADRIIADAELFRLIKIQLSAADGWGDGGTFYKDAVERIRELLEQKQ